MAKESLSTFPFQGNFAQVVLAFAAMSDYFDRQPEKEQLDQGGKKESGCVFV